MKFKPIPHDVEKDNSYFWCSCGRSKNQPFCDGSHAGSEFTPLKYIAEKTETKYFCTCKKTKNKPFCDGSHNKPEKSHNVTLKGTFLRLNLSKEQAINWKVHLEAEKGIELNPNDIVLEEEDYFEYRINCSGAVIL